MMRETGRLLLGIQARARFAAYSVFGRKTDCAAEFIKNRDSYILKSPDGALEVTVSGGKLTYSAAVGKTPVIEPSEIGLLVQGGVNLGEDAVLGEPKTDSREEIRRDPDTETDITDRHINYIFPVRSKKFRYSLEVRIWNDGFGFRLLFDKEYGAARRRRADAVQRARRHGLQISDGPQKDAGQDADKKDLGAPLGRNFLLHDRIRVPRKRHIYNDNRIGYREISRHGAAFARRGQIQGRALGYGQILHKRRKNSLAHNYSLPLARGACPLPRHNPLSRAVKRKNIRKCRMDMPRQERVVVFHRRGAQPPIRKDNGIQRPRGAGRIRI